MSDTPCTHSNTVSVSNGPSDTRRCIDCCQSMTGRELAAARATKKPSRWARLGDAINNAIGQSLFGGSR